jgi:hypothetical protein
VNYASDLSTLFDPLLGMMDGFGRVYRRYGQTIPLFLVLYGWYHEGGREICFNAHVGKDKGCCGLLSHFQIPVPYIELCYVILCVSFR